MEDLRVFGPKPCRFSRRRGLRSQRQHAMDSKVNIRCPACKQVFREKPHKVRDGVQLNCPNCCKLLALNRDTEDPYLRRALKLAKEFRAVAQTQIIEKVYGPGGADSGPLEHSDGKPSEQR